MEPFVFIAYPPFVEETGKAPLGHEIVFVSPLGALAASGDWGVF
jgi:hypothetical protein